MVRIRYNVNEEGTLLISKSISSSNGIFRSEIQRTDNGWSSRITVAKDDSSLLWSEVEGTLATTKNLAVAKAKAKQNLKRLGVHFLEEVRRREQSDGV